MPAAVKLIRKGSMTDQTRAEKVKREIDVLHVRTCQILIDTELRVPSDRSAS